MKTSMIWKNLFMRIEDKKLWKKHNNWGCKALRSVSYFFEYAQWLKVNFSLMHFESLKWLFALSFRNMFVIVSSRTKKNLIFWQSAKTVVFTLEPSQSPGRHEKQLFHQLTALVYEVDWSNIVNKKFNVKFEIIWKII